MTDIEIERICLGVILACVDRDHGRVRELLSRLSRDDLMRLVSSLGDACFQVTQSREDAREKFTLWALQLAEKDTAA